LTRPGQSPRKSTVNKDVIPMESPYHLETEQLLSRPSVANWPDLQDTLRTALSSPRKDWELPSLACRAVGGDPQAEGSVSGALICQQLAITLVDDILDQDPRGLHNTLGPGRVANLSLALVGLATQLVNETQLEPWRKLAILASLAAMGVETAYGQHLDVTEPRTEEAYWTVLHQKSCPFYNTSLWAGALAGGGSLEQAGKLKEVGSLVGEITQIYDDLTDALQTPANPDWKHPGGNLAILFAMSAPHPEQEAFRADLANPEDPSTLRHAQGVLIRCGAVSYCAFHIAQRIRAAQKLVAETGFADPVPLMTLLANQAQPLMRLLNELGVSTLLSPFAEEHGP
jgi:geranylgeranyl pyrophosphate synthase